AEVTGLRGAHAGVDPDAGGAGRLRVTSRYRLCRCRRWTTGRVPWYGSRSSGTTCCRGCPPSTTARTTMEAMELCDGPFIFSHANPQAIKRHYRNLRDDQIKACAATGGVIGINGV